METTHTTTPTAEMVALLAVAAVKAREAKRFAEEAYKAAEADAIEAMLAAGETTIMLADGTRVTVEGIDETRRTIDIAALADVVPATVLDKVTKRAVDLARFDAAVTAGFIASDTAEAVTERKAVKPSLRVTVKAVK